MLHVKRMQMNEQAGNLRVERIESRNQVLRDEALKMVEVDNAVTLTQLVRHMERDL